VLYQVVGVELLPSYPLAEPYPSNCFRIVLYFAFVSWQLVYIP
jgi:hypothetical protein